MKLGRFTTVAGFVIVVSASGLAGYNVIAAGTANSAANALFLGAVTELQHSRDLTHAVDQIKVDVIQVQQWLTDISATRGLDGLNDGYAEAESYAQKLPADLSEARRLAAEIGSDELTTALSDVENAFSPYYAAGKAMAERYIAEGPEGGNLMMGDFDTAAATMASSVDLIESIVDQYADTVGANSTTMQRKLADDQAGRAISQLLTYGILIMAIALMTGFMAGYALRRIRAMSGRMTAIALGDYSTSVYGSSVWEELKDIAAAADIFRENGLRLDELKSDEAVQQEARRVERQHMMDNLQESFGHVVNATIDGDFSQRVPTDFVDPELNRLAQSVNMLVSSIGDGLAETGEVLGSLARFDLTQRMQQQQIGAFAGLRDNTNAVAETLSGLIGKLRKTSSSLRAATSEILAGANDLSERTTRQAATIEQTSAAMEQLASGIAKNASAAAMAGTNSQSVSLLVRANEKEMERATSAMGDISASSAKVQNFIGVIDDIAFQTNLLALNASVEAARAGDAGKGFAVVAIEVRRLAQAAATAAREAKDLVDTSRRHVAGGQAIILDVAGRLSEVTSQVVSAANQMQSIALDSKQQSNAVQEVTVAIRQMDEMTQHNAALVEETNAAIEQTETQAQELDNLIGVFRVNERALKLVA